MLKASQSGLFELYLEALVEGDCYNRSTLHLMLVGEFHTMADVTKAIEATKEWSGYCGFEVRYPEAYARVHNTLAQRQAQRQAQELALRATAAYDPEECPF